MRDAWIRGPPHSGGRYQQRSGDTIMVAVNTRSVGLMSQSSDGVEGRGGSFNASSSGDGRFVVFESDATNLAVGDLFTRPDIFLRDTLTGTTTWLSHAPGGAESGGDSNLPTISDDGRFVAFQSDSNDL